MVPYLIDESQKLEADPQEQKKLLHLFNQILRKLIEEKEALLTDNLAEELQSGLQKFVPFLVSQIATSHVYKDLFEQDQSELPTFEMIELFNIEVNKVKNG